MATTSTPTLTPYNTDPPSITAASTTAASTTAASTTAASTTAASTTAASTTKALAPLSVNTTKLLGDIFKKSNVILLLWFLAIYVVLYFIIGIFLIKIQMWKMVLCELPVYLMV
jgi:hypothetical protein